MATYRQIYLSFWTDIKIDECFTANEKYFYLYLLTNPHTNICGCYEIGIQQMCRETGLATKTTAALIESLQNKHNVIRYNYQTNELLILKWGKYNWTSSGKLIKSVYKKAESIKSEDFKKYVLSVLNSSDEFDKVCIGYSYPMHTTVTVTDTDTVSDTDTDTVSVSISDTVSVGETGKEFCYTSEFIEFWEAYPKKCGKGEAFKIWKKIKPTEQIRNAMSAALEWQKQSEQWKANGGQFIPLPATYLNQRRWEDEKPKTIDITNRNYYD